MKLKFLSLAALALLGTTLVSCSNDDVIDITPGTTDGAAVLAPAKAADINVTSAGSVLATTLKSRAAGDAFSYHKYWDGDFPAEYATTRPGDVTYEEKAFVINYIKEHANEGGVDFNYSNYFIQNIGSSYDTYTGIVDMNGASHQVVGGNQMDYLVINGHHINDYNAAYGPNALILNLPFGNPTYHDSWGNVDNTKTNAYKLYKITYNGKVGFYLGFDYKTKKGSGEVHNGDGVYNDWVVKLVPADGIIEETPGEGTTTPGTTPGTTPDPNPGNTTPVVLTNGGQIEVNLSINEEKTEGDYIATKLSIHVRDTADVEVFLPVEAQYYCEADDMNIVLSHKLEAEKYNDNPDFREMTFTVNGNEIKLTVSYETDGIRVKTSGVNAEVLKYLRDQYGDGITFEVWNYYKSNVVNAEGAVIESFDRTKLQTKLNASTVAFTADPGEYVNAFGPLYDYEGRVYSKIDGETGVWTPYTDEALTSELDAQYWTRSTPEDKYYILKHHKNELDCVVTPVNTAYTVHDTRIYNQVYTK